MCPGLEVFSTLNRIGLTSAGAGSHRPIFFNFKYFLGKNFVGVLYSIKNLHYALRLRNPVILENVWRVCGYQSGFFRELLDLCYRVFANFDGAERFGRVILAYVSSLLECVVGLPFKENLLLGVGLPRFFLSL